MTDDKQTPRALLAVALLLLAGPAWADDPSKWLTRPTPDISVLAPSECVVMSDIFKICGGKNPTIWINPKTEPHDVAEQMIGAFKALGYLPKDVTDAK